MNWGYSLIAGWGLLIAVASLEHELSSCGARALVAQQHVESSRTRDRTRVPCTGSQILNHWTTRESLFWRLNEIIFIKHTARCLTHSKLLFSKPKLMDPFSQEHWVWGVSITYKTWSLELSRGEIRNPCVGTSPVAQQWRLYFQCRRHELDPWSRY